jgi:squalene synthase HpnC
MTTSLRPETPAAESLARSHYENFPVASWLLPARLRRPVALLYAFARTADDVADEGDLADPERLARLDGFERELDAIARGIEPATGLFRALTRIITAHALPLAPFRDLLSAFRQDVTHKRYADFSELEDYCRRSANPVGRLLLVLFGGDNESNRAASDALCTALQLINFQQDVAEDYVRGRVYLPQDELRRFDVAEATLSAPTGDAWQALNAFQTVRVRTLLERSAPLARAFGGRVGIEVRMIRAGAFAVLDKLDANPGTRARLGTVDWVKMLARSLTARE